MLQGSGHSGWHPGRPIFQDSGSLGLGVKVFRHKKEENQQFLLRSLPLSGNVIAITVPNFQGRAVTTFWMGLRSQETPLKDETHAFPYCSSTFLKPREQGNQDQPPLQADRLVGPSDQALNTHVTLVVLPESVAKAFSADAVFV